MNPPLAGGSLATFEELPRVTARSARDLARIGGIAFAWSLALMWMWALASPLGSGPDEPAHLVRAAAVARGDFLGEKSDTLPPSALVVVPAYVAQIQQWSCTAFDANQTAACQLPVQGDPQAAVVSQTSAATNNPGYYLAIGLPTLVTTGDAALYGMRLVASLLGAFSVAIAAMNLAHISAFRFSAVGLLFASTPMALYLSGVANPNGLEALAAAALMSTAVVIIRRHRAGLAIRLASAELVGMTALLLSARTVALLWLPVILVAAAVFEGWRDLVAVLRARTSWYAASGITLVCITVLSWAFFARGFVGAGATGVGISPIDGFFVAFLGTFDYGRGLIGMFGWLESPAPAATLALISVSLATFVGFGALMTTDRAKRTLMLLCGALVLIPPVGQAFLAPSLGVVWQGRYMLPVMLTAIVIAGIALDDRIQYHSMPRAARSSLKLGVAGLAIGHAAAFLWTLRRFTVGLDESFADMLRAPLWSPPGGVVAILVAHTVVIALAALYAYRRAVRTG